MTDTSTITLDDLTEIPDGHDSPWLDDPRTKPQNENQFVWQKYGALHLAHFLPDALIDAYCEGWLREGDATTGIVPWNCTPYMTRPFIRDLCLYPPLMDVLNELIGDQMALHLNLANWRSTRRDWHQDDYLNPAYVNSWYVAVWMALDSIDPDAGPFEYVPGSNHWPVLRREKMLKALGEPMPHGLDEDWPTRSEKLLRPLYDAEIARLKAPTRLFLADRGDVLIWHARTVHRGTVPVNPDIDRKAMIAHYSAESHRHDMKSRATHGDDPVSRFFVL